MVIANINEPVMETVKLNQVWKEGSNVGSIKEMVRKLACSIELHMHARIWVGAWKNQ